MQSPGKMGKAVHTFGIGHIFKNAAMPIYGKNL